MDSISKTKKEKSVRHAEASRHSRENSANSIKLLNRIGFDTLESKDRFNPEKIDFYEIKQEKKICDLNISDYNSENCKYTTLKRSKLVKFLKNRLNNDVIIYNHNIEKIEKNNDQINLIFNNNAHIALSTETIEVTLDDQNEIKD